MSNASKLYIVPTPIGNMSDITLRALEVLKSCDVIACEDTRVTQKLLKHYNITTRTMCYNDFSDQKHRQRIINHLSEGQSIALVSDAGTPLICDPGYKLVREVIKAELEVESLPGASSVVSALILSAQPTNQFTFCGFLPSKQNARIEALKDFKHMHTTLVFFEAARRLTNSLLDMIQVLGNRNAAVVRELTKIHEEVKRNTLDELMQYYTTHPPKGEIIVVLAPAKESSLSDDELDSKLKAALKTMSVREAAEVVAKSTGIKRKIVYERTLQLAGKK